MMDYSKMYHGDNELQKLYRGDTLIWSKGDSSKMPVMTGVTDYFASDVGLTSARWQNQIQGGDNIVWYGLDGMTIQQDGSAGVYGTGNSYGEFTSPYATTRTIYCLFKSPEIGAINSNRHILGSCGGSIRVPRNGAWLTIATEQYSVAQKDTIQSDQWGIGFNSGVKCNDYHVVALTRDSEGMNTIYVDGVSKMTMRNSDPYGGIWGVGVVVDDYHAVFESPNVLQQIHFVSIANTVHTASEIAQNSAWLRQHFLGVNA